MNLGNICSDICKSNISKNLNLLRSLLIIVLITVPQGLCKWKKYKLVKTTPPLPEYWGSSTEYKGKKNMCNLSSPCLTRKKKCYIKYLRMSKVDWTSSFLCKKFKVPSCKFSWIRMSVRCCILCKLSQNIPPNPSHHRVETEGNICTQLKTDFFPTADDVFSGSQSQVSQSNHTSLLKALE